MSPIVESFLLGVTVMASALIALFFLKFWRSTRDGLFLAFAAAFAVECLLRISRFQILRAGGPPSDSAPLLYVIRLLASLLILVAILRKNVGRKTKRS